jgi:hypothetical protein
MGCMARKTYAAHECPSMVKPRLPWLTGRRGCNAGNCPAPFALVTRPFIASGPFWLGVATALAALGAFVAAGSLWLN